MSSLFDLLGTPSDKAGKVRGDNGDLDEDGDHPEDGGDDSDGEHGAVELGDFGMFLSGGEVVEGLSKGEVAHDVEGEEVEPAGGFDGLVEAVGELGDEHVGVFDDAMFIATDCWGCYQ